jgi:hypothetical protein
MRRIQSLFKTLLMLIPMTAVPVMAIFGIPQFFPVSASPTARLTQTEDSGHLPERRVGHSDALLVRNVSTIQPVSIDLFEPYGGDIQSRRTKSGDVVANASSIDLARRSLAWTDPLARPQDAGNEAVRTVGAARTEVSLRTNSYGVPNRSHRQPVEPAIDTESGMPPDKEVSSAASPSFSGQAAVPSRAASLRGNDSPAPTVALEETSFGRASATLAVRSSVEVLGDNDNFDRYGRLTSRTDNSTPDSRSTQVKTFTWQQAVDRLNQLGIRTFRLTPNSGQNGYRFVCLVTSVDDPRISRRFEAESVDPLIAVGDVLAQVEDWNLH